jgi:hypothetical protein
MTFLCAPEFRRRSCKNKFLVLDAVGLHPARKLWNQEVAFTQPLSYSIKEVVCIDEHMNMFPKAKPKFDLKERRA